MVSAMMLLEQRKRIVQNGRSSADCTWLNIVGVYGFTTVHGCTCTWWVYMGSLCVYNVLHMVAPLHVGQQTPGNPFIWSSKYNEVHIHIQ